MNVIFFWVDSVISSVKIWISKQEIIWSFKKIYCTCSLGDDLIDNFPILNYMAH